MILMECGSLGGGWVYTTHIFGASFGTAEALL